jgi:lysophospholipase L1-like esterase
LARPGPWSLVGLGDSITAAQGCSSCSPFVDLYAREITRATSIPISVANLGVGGSTSADLLASLSDEQPAASRVRSADVITVTIGANDFAPQLDTALSGRCGGIDDLECFETALSTLQVNLTAILQRIAELRADHVTAVRVTGYWNVFLDGAVAAHTYGPTFVRSSDELTRRVNTVIKQVTDRSQAQYVDLYRPFKGETGGDDTSLLADDGDHPSQAGHLQIAESLASMGYAPLPAP